MKFVHRFWTGLHRESTVILVAATVAAGWVAPLSNRNPSRGFCRFNTICNRQIRARTQMINDSIETTDPYESLKIFHPSDLVNYYQDVERILLIQGNDGTTDKNVGYLDRVQETQSDFSSISLQERRENSNTTVPKLFTLQHYEPRHRKSMMRCVLNSFHGESECADQKSRAISKHDFQQRLRSVQRRQKWILTRQLLFGADNITGNSMEGGRYWWESGVVCDETAPGLVDGIRGYLKSLNDQHTTRDSSIRIIDERKDDPRKFLSRLARGRAFKGSFRSLLENYVSKSGSQRSANNDLISLYDRIREESQCELEILRLFIDELEAASTSNNCNACESEFTVCEEQISLLRILCNLDIFSSLPPKITGNVSSIDDGGRSVGKRGERDLETFLTKRRSLTPDTKVLSPVWVRPKHKNKRNTKEKCRYVLEIPQMRHAKINGFTLPGTTNEFDAMVVRVIDEDIPPKDFCGNSSTESERASPIMAIQEVWDAKATLDPTSLLDVMEKKARSLQNILFDENSRVMNIPNSSSSTTLLPCHNTSDGANFVILPSLKDKKYNTATGVTTSPVPAVYRVGIEAASNTIFDNQDCDGCHQTPRIGIFASKTIGTAAAARRIQTIVYEKLLETDLPTVRSVIRKHQHCLVEDKASIDNELYEADISHCNQLVCDKSIGTVERILQLIDSLRPLVVVGTLPTGD